MYIHSIKFILLILSFFPSLFLSEQAVQAQSFPSTDIHDEVNDEVIPDFEQPSSPVITPSDTTSNKEDKPRHLRNYIGITGNIGVTGSGEGLSQGGITIIRKNDLNDSLSIRGINVFGGEKNDSTFALTVNFPVKTSSGEVKLVPFIGGGMLLRSKSLFEDVTVRGLVTAGIDIPLSRKFTATSVLNVGLFQQTEVGVQLGVAYNF
jgi:succinyl-CoA synthetase beta subunit